MSGQWDVLVSDLDLIAADRLVSKKDDDEK